MRQYASHEKGRQGRFGALVRDALGRLWLVKRNLSPSAHQLRKPRAWSVDAGLLAELRRRGGAGVKLYLINGQVWEATLADFDRFGFEVDRGAGAQVGLELRRWRRPGSESVGHPVLFPVA